MADAETFLGIFGGAVLFAAYWVEIGTEIARYTAGHKQFDYTNSSVYNIGLGQLVVSVIACVAGYILQFVDSHVARPPVAGHGPVHHLAQLAQHNRSTVVCLLAPYVALLVLGVIAAEEVGDPAYLLQVAIDMFGYGAFIFLWFTQKPTGYFAAINALMHLLFLIVTIVLATKAHAAIHGNADSHSNSESSSSQHGEASNATTMLKNIAEEVLLCEIAHLIIHRFQRERAAAAAAAAALGGHAPLLPPAPPAPAAPAAIPNPLRQWFIGGATFVLYASELITLSARSFTGPARSSDYSDNREYSIAFAQISILVVCMVGGAYLALAPAGPCGILVFQVRNTRHISALHCA